MKVLLLVAVLLPSMVLLSSCQPSLQVLPTAEPSAASTDAVPATRNDPAGTFPVGLTASDPAPLSTAVEVDGMTLTLVGTGLPSGFPPAAPDPGQRFVSPRVTASCLRSPGSTCPPLGSFELIDSEGTRHSPSIAVGGLGFLPHEAFPGGTSVSGSLVFMVPADPGSLTLRYVGHQGAEAFFLVEEAIAPADPAPPDPTP